MYEVLTVGEYARRLEEVWWEGYCAGVQDEGERREPTPQPLRGEGVKMEIYMVREEVEYETYDIIAAYLDEDTAKQYAQMRQEIRRYPGVEYWVEKWEVN